MPLCGTPLPRDLMKIPTSKLGHSSFFTLKCTDFKNVILEKNPLPLSEVAEVNQQSRFNFIESKNRRQSIIVTFKNLEKNNFGLRYLKNDLLTSMTLEEAG